MRDRPCEVVYYKSYYYISTLTYVVQNDKDHTTGKSFVSVNDVNYDDNYAFNADTTFITTDFSDMSMSNFVFTSTNCLDILEEYSTVPLHTEGIYFANKQDDLAQ